MSEDYLEIAGREHLDALRPLWVALHDHHAAIAPRGTATRSREDSWRRELAKYKQYLETGSGFLVLAHREATLIGFALVHMQAGLAIWATPDVIGTLETLSVLPEYRSDGVGQRLLRKAEEETARRGAPELWLGVLVTNHDADRFYQCQGYEQFSREYRRDLR